MADESGTSESDSADDPRWSSRVFEATAIWRQRCDLVREQISVAGKQWNLHVCSIPRLDGLGNASLKQPALRQDETEFKMAAR